MRRSAKVATPPLVTWVVVPVSGPRPDPGASDTVIGTAAEVTGTPAPSTTATVTGGPAASNGAPVMRVAVSASAGGVPKARPHWPETGVVRFPVIGSSSPWKLPEDLTSTSHLPGPA